MTRIETALSRMLDETDLMDVARQGYNSVTRPPVAWSPAMLATPTGAALTALVEAAEAWYMGGDDSSDARLTDAVIAFRAATEPQP